MVRNSHPHELRDARWGERRVLPHRATWQDPASASVFTPDRVRNLGRPEVTRCSLDSLGVRSRELRQALTAESRSGTGTPAHPASTPYWTTFELPLIDVKAASVGILDQIVAGLRYRSLRSSRGGSLYCGSKDAQIAT